VNRVRFGRYGVVLYFSFGVPRASSGIAYGPVVFIRPEYAGDRGLLEHELAHTRQFWNPRKWFKGRLWWEVEAYRAQRKWYPEDRTREFARLIATSYGLDVSEEQAREMLGGAAAEVITTRRGEA
jgi:predicted metalloprotease with PDZ domain